MPPPESGAPMLHLQQPISVGSFHSFVLIPRRDAQFHPKAAASVWFRFYPNFTSHAFDNFANNREAHTSALILIIELLEHREQARLRVFGNTDSFILNPNPRKAVLNFGPHTHGRAGARDHELHRIAEQI